jgi:16S rRNA (uracil1498-N3)-methyltransferase
MHRFLLPPEACLEPELLLPEDESHHATDVLRLRRGDEVSVLDGSGGEYCCVVVDARRQSMRVEVRSSRKHPRPEPLVLVQALLKGKAMDLVLQKAVELGVTRLMPLLAERSIPHPENYASDKSARWQSIINQALKQCGNPWKPQLDTPLTLRECLDQLRGIDLNLLADLSPGSGHPRAWFEAWRQAHPKQPPSVAAWIGPEGDFTSDERVQVLAHHGCPITLGPRVLRSETAALYCLSVAQYERRAPAS